MNRILKATLVAVVVSGGLIGCVNRPGVEARYNNVVDPCWPERYNYQAREAVLYPFEQQATNGHTMDQTVWNYHFDAGTATLNAAGREKLDQLARRRGCPDGKIFLQTARDLAYDAKNPNKLVMERSKLDVARGDAILAYMGTQPTAQTMRFEVQPIDPVDPSINSQGPATAVRGLPSQYQSTVTGAVGGTVGGAGGGAAPGTPAAGAAPGGAAAAPTTR
jgi:hypothetical protein